jgi:hypothetical protein
MAYINLPVVTDSNVLIQQALTNISANIPGWVPREGNLEVLLLEQFALMAAEAANVASNVPDTIFTYFGSLVGITPNTGASATIKANWTLISTAPSGGYTIPAGTIAGFYYAGAAYQFQTMTDVTIPFNETSMVIEMQAVSTGSVYNIKNIGSLNVYTTYLQLVTPDPQVANILITATAETDATLVRGTDPETTTSFLNRLTAELQLLAPRPITPSDFAAFSQNYAGVYRAFSFDGFNPFTNRLATADANFLTFANSSSAPSGWGVFANGTATPPAISTPGTAGSNYLQFTSTSTVLVNGVSVKTASIQNATSLTVTVGTGSFFSTTISSNNPCLILIEDAVNGNEIALVTAAAAKSGSGAGTSQVLTVGGVGLEFAHNTSATVTQLEGVIVPNVTGLAANSDWYQAACVLQASSATTATEKPYICSIATYVDGTVEVFSSVPQFSDSLYSYTSNPKTIVCNIESTAFDAVLPLAYDSNATSTYANLKPYISSVQSYIAFKTTELNKTHKIYYNSLNEINLDLTPTGILTVSSDDPTASTSNYNFIPDSTFSNFLYTNASLASWNVPAGVTALPNYGVQFNGTGSALGSNLTVQSQIFNLLNISSDVSGTSRTYTLFANIDANYVTSGLSDVIVKIVDASNTSTILATFSPTAAQSSTLVATFTLSAPKDVLVQIVFATGLNAPLGSSVIVSNVGVLSGTYTSLTLPEYEQNGYFWTPGGLYNPNTFNYPRNVTVAPVDSNGLALSASSADGLSDYLAARREVNFTVQTINPSYVPIDVVWSGYVSPGYTSSSVQTDVNNAIRNFLNPATWGGGGNTPAYWDGSANTIRVFDIAGIILNVPGVSSILSVTIRTSYPTNGSFGTSDIVMTGIAPLPLANTITGSLFTNSANAYSGLG